MQYLSNRVGIFVAAHVWLLPRLLVLDERLRDVEKRSGEPIEATPFSSLHKVARAEPFMRT